MELLVADINETILIEILKNIININKTCAQQSHCKA